MISKNSADELCVWESGAGDSCTVQKDPERVCGVCGEIKRGTNIICYLKEDQSEVLEERRPRDLAEEHSEEKEKRDEDKEGDEPNIEEVYEASHEWEQLHKNEPLGMCTFEDTTSEVYATFYESLPKDWADHLAVKHVSVEGQLEFSALIFTPSRALLDRFDSRKKRNSIKLYLHCVFIMDDRDEHMPEWLY